MAKLLARISQFFGKRKAGETFDVVSEEGNEIFASEFTHHLNTTKGKANGPYADRPDMEHRIGLDGYDKMTLQTIAYQVSRSHDVILHEMINKSYKKESHIGLDGELSQTQELYRTTTIEYCTKQKMRYDALKTKKDKEAFLENLEYSIRDTETFTPVLDVLWLYKGTNKISQNWVTNKWREEVDKAMDMFDTRQEMVDYLLPIAKRFKCKDSEAFELKYETVNK